MSKEQFEDLCYEAYKLNWMLSHGYTLTDFLNILKEGIAEEIECGEIDPKDDPEKEIIGLVDSSYENYFLDSQGFGSGSLWVRKDEFLQNEFTRPNFMMDLFSGMGNRRAMEDFYTKNYSVYSGLLANSNPGE